jgi:two-component system sensor histidine kinase EvgS
VKDINKRVAAGRPCSAPLIHALHLLSFLLAILGSSMAQAVGNLTFSLNDLALSTAPLTLSVAEREWLEARGTLRVGVMTADHEPFDIAADRNRYEGISADYLSLIGKQLGVKWHIMGFSRPDDAIQALREGSIDMLPSANAYKRGAAGLLSSRSYLADRSVLVMRGTAPLFGRKTAAMKIVMVQGYAHSNAVQSAYPQSEIILAPSLFSAVQALVLGDVDALLANEIIISSYLALRPYLDLRVHSPSVLPADGFSFALRKQDAPLLQLVDRVLQALEPELVGEIAERWTLGQARESSNQRVALSRTERNWIRKHPVVTVASQQHSPYIYRDKDGSWVGLNVDVLSRISRLTGLRFTYVESSTIEQTYTLMSSGQAQMNTTLAENAERRELFDFSHAFGGNSWVLVVRADSSSPLSLAELDGQILALPANHALEHKIAQDYPGIRLRRVADYAQARELVESGIAAAAIQNEAGAYLHASGTLKIGRSLEGWWSPDRFSVIKSEPELLGILNKALEEFPVMDMRAIRAKWLLEALPPESLWKRIPQGVWWALPVAVLWVLSALLWRRRLQSETRRRSIAENALSDALAFRQSLLSAVPAPVYVRDLQGRLVSCNRSYEESLGLSFEQMNGRRTIDVELIPASTARLLHDDYVRMVTLGESTLVRRSMQLPGGPISALHWTAPYARADGQVQGVLGGWIEGAERNERSST